MKKFLLMMVMMITSLSLFAQTGGELVGGDSGIVLDLTTFTGIAAAVSMLVTQLSKVIKAVNDSKWLKVVIAFVSGIVICMLTKLLGIQSPLLELSWGGAVIYGLFAGSVSAGFYDLLKMIYNMFFKNKESQ